MMALEGWVKLHRRISENDLWTSEKFTRGQAWIDMIMLANHSDGFIRSNGMKIPIKRGQLGWSEIKLSERWKWSRGKVRRFLKELKNEQMIVQQKSRRNPILTVINYEMYQSDGTPDGQVIVHQTDNRQYPNKNVKNEKNVKKVSTGTKKTQIPDDWKPNEKAKEIADDEGYSLEELNIIADNFINYAESKGATYVKWDSAFYKWIRSTYTRQDVESRRGVNGKKSLTTNAIDDFFGPDLQPSGGLENFDTSSEGPIIEHDPRGHNDGWDDA